MQGNSEQLLQLICASTPTNSSSHVLPAIAFILISTYYWYNFHLTAQSPTEQHC